MAPIASAITRVLITGFGPFSGIPNNPSFGIASRLPSSLPNDIELIVHPYAVPVAYHPTLNAVSRLYSEVQPDLSLHMGVAEGRTYFAIEQTSRRNVYHIISDVDGQVFTPEENEAVWAGQPELLSTELDLNAVVADWKNRTADFTWPFSATSSDVMSVNDVQWSDSVGNYLCGFIYFAGMAEMGSNGKNKKRDVSFMHVPLLKTEEELQLGVDVAIELIQSLVQSWRSQRTS
ncbi:hypothetical protein BDV95DRAFT_537799 [Massariosphaeria phaeospora]|uniref:Peptidase C15, pyroglutamyl peptidase I-like protein n=1 Tax=Massariosphaeria phaeospora TaxID=100035 RepID=A0A7C8ICD8_9PLEO|nr:hypothetical protein BDV95DRAFT_537799 [Massariosphaeria phaeospora]